MIKEKLMESYYFSKDKHEGQVRKHSSLPYFSHPKYVARLLERVTDDVDIVIAGFLHDTLEDTDTTFKEIVDNFGKRVAHIVKEVTNSKSERGSLKKRDYILKKMTSMSNDALLVKLADRFHNVYFMDADNDTKESQQFLEYYWSNTKYIITELLEIRDVLNISKAHWVLVKMILNTLKVLELNYNLS